MKLKIEYVPITSITPYENNAKLHPKEQVEQIIRSIEDYGMNDPIAVWHDEIVEGHGRYLACVQMGIDTVPVIRLDDLTDEQRREYMLVHNKTTMNSGFDIDLLNLELTELPEFDAPFYDFESLSDFDNSDTEQKGSMKDKYLVPPFSVIYGNKPDWLARKRAWIDFGIRSEVGRGDKLAFNSLSNPQANFVPSGGGYERSKAFKNNSQLNRYQKQKRMRMG